ncbi:ABC transporter substrate-binding protein [Klebsiella sp. GN_Kp186]|uniref:ABC transporter substrate-binding protein n=1 Tax=Enterobacteriaceae TaxID=543 RepID=UPI0011B9DF8F|nr:ABC transporter substrate-binding protein [Enterobacter roggenkampii]HBR2160701.1 ABC transporter substrate-binding protein [Klebsiella pneumoniae]HCI5980977.1 ABC transporter substrate-binding protein [Klebsiella variicola subsp. variicola]TWY14882.1 substrate-binding domain-containing protein [Enterobacter roggenkampii]HBS4522058.1 ABC transporter substrate-binding protein [Klebsiella pneumoniae]HBW3297671.1 substrate-binding domain-containing protein [Klebsiella pneumoniae]
MTKLRKAWLAVAVTAVITTMTGFIPAASAAPQEGKKISHIGLMVQDMSNPFFSAMERNAKQAAAKIGATLNVQDAQVDLANQNTQIDAFIQQKVDLIIISAVDESGIEPAIQRAKAAGIIVIAVDTPARGADAEIMTNAIQAGETSCEYLFSQMGGKGKVLLVDGTPIQTIIDRIKGCKNVAQKYPDIKIVGQQASRNDRSSSLMVTTDMLTANPDVSGIFGMNDPSALGAVLAVEQAGKAGAIKVTGVDGSPEAVEELKRSGSPFIGTATQNPGEMVRQAISLAQDMVDGKHIASPTVLIPSVLVTRDNVDSYPGW